MKDMIEKIDINEVNALKVLPIRKDAISSSFNADTLYNVERQGLTLIRIILDTPPPVQIPGDYGLFEHLQRESAGTATISQIIMQTFSSDKGIYMRRGKGNGVTIIYTEWVKIV